MTMKTHTNTTSRACTPWLPAVASAVLALAAGCMDDPPAAPAEPVADDTQAITVPAGADTSAALGITTWRYIPADEGLVVRGLGSDDLPRARFWIAAGDSLDERIAYATDTGARVTIPREGALRGDDELLEVVTAFGTDVDAQVSDKTGTQQVNDNVTFCPGSVGTFGTWAFWGTTTIAIDNPFQDQWLKFSFQAGAGYEEQWVPPAPYSSVPWLNYTRTYPRQYWGVPVTIRYLDSWPNGSWGPCRRVRVY